MLGWIQQGGLSAKTTVGWEDQGDPSTNHTKADPDDTSSNEGTFPQRYQALYGRTKTGDIKGMPGYDWCGMFLGYIYTQLLKLDTTGMGKGTAADMETWRGADTISRYSGDTHIWPVRDRDPNSATFGKFQGWGDRQDGSPGSATPLPGDLAVISP